MNAYTYTIAHCTAHARKMTSERKHLYQSAREDVTGGWVFVWRWASKFLGSHFHTTNVRVQK